MLKLVCSFANPRLRPTAKQPKLDSLSVLRSLHEFVESTDNSTPGIPARYGGVGSVLPIFKAVDLGEDMDRVVKRTFRGLSSNVG